MSVPAQTKQAARDYLEQLHGRVQTKASRDLELLVDDLSRSARGDGDRAHTLKVAEFFAKLGGVARERDPQDKSNLRVINVNISAGGVQATVGPETIDVQAREVPETSKASAGLVNPYDEPPPKFEPLGPLDAGDPSLDIANILNSARPKDD